MSPHDFKMAAHSGKMRKLKPSNSSKDLSSNSASFDLRDAKIKETVAAFPDIDIITPALNPKIEEIIEANEVVHRDHNIARF